MLTEDAKQELLEQERLIAEVMKIRRGPAEEQHWWTAPHITSTLTAVLTVAVTTVASYYMQAQLKSRDYALARQDLRLTQTRDAMVTVYELLTALLKGTQDRQKIATGQYAELSDTMVNLIVDETNAIDSLWRHKRETAEAGLYLYFGDSQPTIDKWLSARRHMQAYADCAEQAFMASLHRRIDPRSCESERRAAESAFVDVRDALIVTYRAKLAG